MKIKIIGITIAVASILISSRLIGQDQLSTVREFGLGLSNFNNFSLQYRWGNEHRLFRLAGNIGETSSSGNSSANSYNIIDTMNTSNLSTTKTVTPLNLNCGLSFSILKIKSVSEKFGLLYGGIFSFSYSINKTNTDGTATNNQNTNPNNNNTTISTTKKNSQTFQPMVGIALGAVYKINSSFLLYAEIDPNIYYSYQMTTMNSTSTAIYANYSTRTRTDISPGSSNTFGLANLTNSGASLTIVYRITK